ncbi:hypothetical protein HJC23_000128 [Cyclotella cryptica]|uniref:Uncharacterized protein n=1 Tax=Cyclotella cryptica TaxID=29204 RepID=A0ABD3NJN0_9STRA|eukprot:CCRYP_020737-RA/>CCRYP_020737-RA protein AED:0.07 eAED:0.07 QI:0/-1/0/1/-1/1/1/0/474
MSTERTGLTLEEKQEANERQLAELEFIKSAYIPGEAWPIAGGINGRRSVGRLLQLPVNISCVNKSEHAVTIEMIMQMPPAYPIQKDSCLGITASLLHSPANPPFIRKAALNALSPLVGACQTAACDFAEAHDGGEAVWHVLNRADEWIDDVWLDILKKQEKQSIAKSLNVSSSDQISRAATLGRRCIYSHHIIASSKRKALASLASEYDLGGYVKIGWPGIIIVEGCETSCVSFVDEIKSWRWQYLSVRFEEQTEISDGEDIDSRRLLPHAFMELGEDDMSRLARYCRDNGLEHMLLACLKISDGRQSVNECEAATDIKVHQNSPHQHHFSYAALIHVDHMNDRKGYQTWLRKQCGSTGCCLFITHCFSSTSSFRPMIYVALIGDKTGVKEVLKKWRISRVDVDSKKKPCLERMMNVLVEGEFQNNTQKTLEEIASLSSQVLSDEHTCSLEEFQKKIGAIFGDEWASAVRTTTP